MPLEIKKNQSTVCIRNEQLQVWSSKIVLPQYPLMIKSPPDKDRQTLTSSSTLPAYTHSPYTPQPTLCLHVLPSARTSSIWRRWPAIPSNIWHPLRQDCPENSLCKLVWEKSNPFRLLMNVTAHLLEKIFMIYVPPLPLWTPRVLC